MGITVMAGNSGGAAAFTDNSSGSPAVVIGQEAFNHGLANLGNIIHELCHGRAFQLYDNIRGQEDLRMREIGAHRCNIENPLPGTRDWEIKSRQSIIDSAYDCLSPKNKYRVGMGIYYGD